LEWAEGRKKNKRERKDILKGKNGTHKSCSKNLSPSLAIHLPRLLNVEPLINIEFGTPDWNHEPSQRCGNAQFEAEMRKEEKNWLNWRLNLLFTKGTWLFDRKLPEWVFYKEKTRDCTFQKSI
jgi:hypothetical protein